MEMGEGCDTYFLFSLFPFLNFSMAPHLHDHENRM